MCGIAGFIGVGDEQILKSMTDTLVHRGPDEEGHWVDIDKGIYLGHRRLSIIDIISGQQPMCLVDNSLCVVFNGEIYNHIELREELQKQGAIFESDHSDTEVLLHGYRQWGIGLPNRLNGMWSFAIYDYHKQQFFCSRDRFGKKPFYYTLQNDTFIFASELSAVIKHPSASTRLSHLALQKYFGYGYIPAPHSIW